MLDSQKLCKWWRLRNGEKIERKVFKTTHTELKVERKIAKKLNKGSMNFWKQYTFTEEFSMFENQFLHRTIHIWLKWPLIIYTWLNKFNNLLTPKIKKKKKKHFYFYGSHQLASFSLGPNMSLSHGVPRTNNVWCFPTWVDGDWQESTCRKRRTGEDTQQTKSSEKQTSGFPRAL